MPASVLAKVVLTAMMQFVPPESHDWHQRRHVTESAYVSLAMAIANVALDPNEMPIEDDRVLTAIILASVASYESVFAVDVMTCKKAGRGHAFGPYQFQGPRQRVCRSFQQATRHALQMVRESWSVCAEVNVRDRLGFYTDGQCRSHWWRSRSRVERAFGFLGGDGV